MLQITINASVQPFMALHDLAGGITFSNLLSLLLL
jgi:hypothetical protein